MIQHAHWKIIFFKKKLVFLKTFPGFFSCAPSLSDFCFVQISIFCFPFKLLFSNLSGLFVANSHLLPAVPPFQAVPDIMAHYYPPKCKTSSSASTPVNSLIAHNIVNNIGFVQREKSKVAWSSPFLNSLRCASYIWAVHTATRHKKEGKRE